MEYRKIAAHLTPKSACKQPEQELEAKSATQKEKIDHIIEHFDVVFEGIGKHRYRQIKLPLMKLLTLWYSHKEGYPLLEGNSQKNYW